MRALTDDTASDSLQGAQGSATPRRGWRCSLAREALALLLALAVPLPLQAQDTPADQARSLLEKGREYRSQGKDKQALENFSTVVTGFSQTEYVDDALLEIGRYYMEVEHNTGKAKETFERVAKQYSTTDSAPGAYYYLGRLILQRAASPAELDDALADFDRVLTLSRRSEWVPRALHGSGLVQRKAGRLAEALDAARRVSLEYPSSDVAAESQFAVGHVLGLMGEYRKAMEEFQRVRNRFPESPWAVLALDRITALWRLYGTGTPSFNPDPAFALAGGDVLKDVRALLALPDGTLWVASEKTGSAVCFGRDGKMTGSLTAPDVRSLGLSPSGDVLVTAKLAVRVGTTPPKGVAIPTDKAVPEPLEKLTAAVVSRSGTLLVADEKKKRVYRFDGDYKYLAAFPDAKEREIARMTLDGEGDVMMLDTSERTLRVFDETGKLLRSVALRGSGYELKKPVDFAVDALRNTYVADEEQGVVVFSPQGQRLVTVCQDAPKIKAIALDATGAVLVYSDKLQKVLRYR